MFFIYLSVKIIVMYVTVNTVKIQSYVLIYVPDFKKFYADILDVLVIHRYSLLKLLYCGKQL